MLHGWRALSFAEKLLLTLFVLSLPFVHPQIRLDGTGYYAYARSILIDHNLQFAGDWTEPGGLFPVQTVRDGKIVLSATTSTGHLPNHYSVGPAILWLPFLAVTHAAVLLLNHWGWHIKPDGHSRPYIVSLAAATAFYSFWGLWLSFRLTRRFFDENWALLATLAIWLGSSLTVYLYVDPSWSHAHSAFAVSLFLWYWLRTRGSRTSRQWLILGLISGFMVEVYYANVVFLLVPLVEALPAYRDAWRSRATDAHGIRSLVQSHALCALSATFALLPTFITRQIIFGSPFHLGIYTESSWNWSSPAFWGVLFSTNNGLLICTPVLIPAIAGLFLLWRQRPEVGGPFLAAAIAFYCLIAFYPWWNGMISFGNRYFVSLTPLFILGLAAAFSTFARLWADSQAAARRVVVVVALLIAWNVGLAFQFSTHLFPNSGPVRWDEVLYDQFRVVPGEALHSLTVRFTGEQKTPGAKQRS